MSTQHVHLARLRTRWSAIGAVVAIVLGAGGLSMAQAAVGSGEKPITVTIEPVRILDTRINLGLSGRFADAAPRDLPVSGAIAITPGSGGKTNVIPADAVGVLVNVTVVTPTHDGFLSLRPFGAEGEPTTSNVNFTPGAIEPNAATVDLNEGKIQIWVETSSELGTAHVLIDLLGYTIDHTHDDRYLTEDETDAALEEKADAADVYTKTEVDALTTPLFATIQADGTVYHGASGLVSSARTGIGEYALTFDRDVSQCGYATADILFGGTRDVSAEPSGSVFTVEVTNAADAAEDTYFSIIVLC